ncbi:Ankyrin repeat protein [Aspergillus sclerotialis]|uniref:Ankyrin repeat protein n=1 Tax=Aspergillus sclerotialis TaxID=2070753 RepID=A0A3A2Z842_9EURO|nr:Ankyrin repeat protein [Aspergillus sclerotialis]
MNDLAQKLDDLIGLLNGGDDNLSVLSSHISSRSVPTSDDWQEIYSELVRVGFPPDVLSEQREYIQRWLANAAMAGRIEVQTQEEARQRARINQQAEPSQANDGAESITTAGLGTSSLPSRSDSVRTSQRYSVYRQDMQGLPTATGSKKASTKWTKSLATKLKYVTLDPSDTLGKAVWRGDARSVKSILSSSNKIDKSESYWFRLLYTCIKQGNAEIFRDLMQFGGAPDLNNHLEDCIWIAISRKRVEEIGILLTNEGDTLDHEGYAHYFLFNAAKHGHENVFQSLVARYRGINAPVNDTTAFHLACRSGNTKSIQFALELGANVNTMDAQGDSPLHALILGGGSKRYNTGTNIMLLTKNSAALHRESRTGQTALHLAAKYTHTKAIEVLVQIGLDIEIRNADGNTPLHLACNPEWVTRSVERFVPARLKRKISTCTMIDFRSLGDRKLVDPREETYHPGQREDAIRLLLSYGAWVNIRGRDNITPLHLAAASSNAGRIRALLEYGADPLAIDDYGWTPLHFAVISTSQDAIDRLLPYSIDPYKTALVSIIGTHEDKMDVFDLIRIVNGFFRREEVHLDRDQKDKLIGRGNAA